MPLFFKTSISVFQSLWDFKIPCNRIIVLVVAKNGKEQEDTFHATTNSFLGACGLSTVSSCCLYIFLVFLFFVHICVVLLSYLCLSFVIFVSFCLYLFLSACGLSLVSWSFRRPGQMADRHEHCPTFFHICSLNIATWYSHVKFSSDQMIFSSACVSKTDMATMSYILSLGPHNHIQIIFSTCFFRTGFSWYKDWHENHLTFLSLRACNIFISQIHWQTFLLKNKGDPGSILYYILCNCAVFQMVWVVSTLCWANTSSNSID